ncbi:MAG: hemerythrin domain-containing protein [Candidatus Eremiobacteraeota bacterium]|nr:hemerythrin domain-containing protein [Candidatus Eremiobacteraeota bacterium]MCW5870022.1 hemerythrin domain-containing protein [Candidatus Eremiobacteraeota bacterium]
MFFPDSLVVDIVGGHPGLSVVLEEWGIDTGRAGGQTLRAACQSLQLDLDEICRQLERAREACPEGLAGLSRAELMAHVRQVHHGYLRRHLPGLQKTARDAARIYGAEHKQLRHVDQIFRLLAEELHQHLAREEQFAFPWLGSQALSPLDLWMLDSLAEYRRKTVFRLNCLRFLTNHYTLPESAGESLRKLYNGLKDLDRDFQRHAYVEERYLFPRQLAA